MKPTLFVMFLFAATSSYASDAYFVRFNAVGGPGNSVLWADDILFYNSNQTPASVHFRGVSNGSARVGTPDLTLPPQQVISARANSAITELWAPEPNTVGLWVLHLDVPTGVIVESRDEFYFTIPLPGQMSIVQPRGKVSMPVFRGLAAPNDPQVHLGTDLSGVTSRVNVGIYNAGDLPANTTIEVRRACDNTIIATRALVVPANTVTQAVGVAVVGNVPCAGSLAAPWVYTITAIVDQPSLTFVSNLNENYVQPANEIGVLPIVGLAVTKNERF